MIELFLNTKRSFIILKLSILIVIFSTNTLFAQNTWQKMNFPSDGKVYHIADDNENYVYCTVYDEGIYRYDKSQQSWKKLENDWNMNNPRFGEIVIGKKGYIYAINRGEGLKRSSDNGETWEMCGFGIPFIAEAAMVQANNKGDIFTIFHNDIYQLKIDDSTYWKPIYIWNFFKYISHFSFDFSGNIIAVEEFNDDSPGNPKYFALLTKYDFNNFQWENIKDTLPDNWIQHMSIDKSGNLYINVKFENREMDHGFFINYKNENKWIELYGNLFNYFYPEVGIDPVEFIPIDKDNSYMAITQGILRCNNNNFNFEYFNDGIENPNDPGCLYLSKSGNLYTSFKGEVYYTQEPVTNINIKEFKVDNLFIHPNPCSEFLYISSDVQPENIEIYNQLGILCIKLMNVNIQNNQIKIDVDKLKPGVYFLRINSSNKVQQLKFIKI